MHDLLNRFGHFFRIFRIMVISGTLVIVLSFASSPRAAFAHDGSDTSNCAATPYHFHGQSHGHISGTNGGVAADLGAAKEEDVSVDPNRESRPVDEFETHPENSVDNASEPTSSSSAGPYQVAILIVDDFKNPSASGALTHGSLVREIFDQLVTAFSATLDVSGIQLVNVDVGWDMPDSIETHYRTEDIAAEIQRNIEALEQDGVSRFVVNMSFGVIPCHVGINPNPDGDPDTFDYELILGVDQDLAMTQGYIYFDFFYFLEQHMQFPTLSLSQYVAYLWDYAGQDIPPIEDNGAGEPVLPDNEAQLAFGRTVMSDLMTVPGEGEASLVPDSPTLAKRPITSLQKTFTPDPLQTLLQSYLDTSWDTISDLGGQADESSFIIVPVGAAGNIPGITSVIPGAWPEVVSISASLGNTTDRWASSSNGEIMTHGAWYLFSDGNYRAGTSFAAPAASVLIAQYLSTHDLSTCTFREGVPLFADYSFSPAVENYGDRPFSDLVGEYCP
jgi:hypothetical protein